MTHSHHFLSRKEAGSKLAERMVYYAGRPDTMVLCLSRSAIDVAKSLSHDLRLPCYWFPVKSVHSNALGHPLKLATVVDGMVVVHEELIKGLGITAQELETSINGVKSEIKAETDQILAEGDTEIMRISHEELENKTLILVTDTLILARRARAAVTALRKHFPSANLVLASPIIDGETEHLLQRDVMEVCSFSSPRVATQCGIKSIYEV